MINVLIFSNQKVKYFLIHYIFTKKTFNFVPKIYYLFSNIFKRIFLMKKLFFLLVMLLFSLATQAQETKFSVKVSKTTVKTNTKFNVEFVLENAGGGQFQAPKFEDFTVVGGPNQSSQMSIMNGEMSQSMTYTYTLMPKKTGEFVLPAASMKLKNETLKTEKVKIKVTAPSDEEDDEDTAMEENAKIKTPNSQIPSGGFGNDFFQQFFQQMPRAAPKKADSKPKRKSYNL